MEQQLSPISEIYQQIIVRCLDSNEQLLVFAFIQKSDLELFINDSIQQVERIIHDLKVAKKLKVDQIKTIAYSILKRFNKAISTLKNVEEKKELKKLLVKLGNAILLEIQQQAPINGGHVRKAIDQGLEQAVLIEGYDKIDFESYFQINYTDISRMTISVTSEIEFTEYLLWNHRKASLSKLFSLLHNDYFCIKSKSEFQSLFDNPQSKSLIKWDGNQTDFLILLFHRLYESKYVNLKGGKGLWKVIKGRFVDFDKKSLDFDMAKRLNILKGKKPLKPALVLNVEEVLKHIKITTVP